MITPKEQYRRAWQRARMVRPILKYTYPGSWAYDNMQIKAIDLKTRAIYPYTYLAKLHLEDRERE